MTRRLADAPSRDPESDALALLVQPVLQAWQQERQPLAEATQRGCR